MSRHYVIFPMKCNFKSRHAVRLGVTRSVKKNLQFYGVIFIHLYSQCVQKLFNRIIYTYIVFIYTR